MKRLVTDWRAGVAVLTLVVLIFTPYGARASLKRAVQKVEEQFFTGVDGRGAVADYLSDCADAALGLVTVGDKYEAAEEETYELREDRHIMLESLEDKDVFLIVNAIDLLDYSFQMLRDALLALPLTEEDVRSLKLYVKNFDGAMGAIAHAGYDEAAKAFIADVYERFPASFIASALGVEPPQIIYPS